MAGIDMNCHLSVEDSQSFFQSQRNECLFGAQSGNNTDLNFVAKSGDLVSGHQGVLLPLSSHLKSLVESTECCGCPDGVPTVLLPDWDSKVVQALVNLLYSGSATVTGDGIEDLLRLVHELRFDVSRDQLVVEPMVQLSDGIINHSNSDKSTMKELDAQKQLSDDKQEVGCIQKKRFNNVHTQRKYKEQECVIKKLREVVDIFESVQIMTEEAFDVIRKPLDDLFSSLKYLPTESSIDILPTEIKADILSYLCDSGSLVAASVCIEWKELLKKRLVLQGEIKLGKHCSNDYSCKARKCFMLEEMLKASLTVKLDVRLKICHPLGNIGANLIAESLADVSEFRITDQCSCVHHYNLGFGMLTENQMQVLFDTLEQRNDPVKSIELYGLSMVNLDQDKLINCLLGVNKLLLGHGVLLNVIRLLQKLLQNTPDLKLSQLYLEDLPNLHFSNDASEAIEEYINEVIADALCQVETIYLGRRFPLEFVTIHRLLNNIINMCDIKIENLFIFFIGDWSGVISPQDLKIVLTKLKRFSICGAFTFEQLEAARSIPSVSIVPDVVGKNIWCIKRGFDIDISQVTKLSFKLSEIFFNE